ncbi:hypothetical protein [Phenylobacterium sp.]|uniref:hypothetical protein n=1 Tax=Phenylobacterium sp. TaxID=1871053 RepID=UPI0027314684|nr:hypothetical protein [Phenylobacterium sp.]MDP1616270.1 hypothetical protein [Phenylobacterium sp.]MDP1988867.1 hypothetical protein [Phenylobacterium sp.]
MIVPNVWSLAAVLALAPALATAAPLACWYEHGVIVAPANVAGAAGDYILDTGAARTELHDTRAQGMGLSGDSAHGDVDIGGFRFPDRDLAIVSQDARTYAFPTPIAGVIGADVLRAVIVDVDFRPCRVELHAPAEAPAPGRGAAPQALQWAAGRPVVTAALSDGRTSRRISLAASTGLAAAVRLAPGEVDLTGVSEPESLAPFETRRADLRALSMGGELFETLKVGLSGDEVSAVGPGVLQRWRLRFNFPAGRILLIPAERP